MRFVKLKIGGFIRERYEVYVPRIPKHQLGNAVLEAGAFSMINRLNSKPLVWFIREFGPDITAPPI